MVYHKVKAVDSSRNQAQTAYPGNNVPEPYKLGRCRVLNPTAAMRQKTFAQPVPLA
jgi:hypothetical protein